MTHLLDVPFLLRLAERLPGDPQTDDLGPLFAAVARHGAAALETEVYGSDWLKAAALLHTLARLPCLEHSSDLFAWAATEAFLDVNGRRLAYEPAEAVALVDLATEGRAGVRRLAATLRSWSN